tara:strand:- start:89 stop:340 length:252 start_codon:yes stop_codon:yes gene_type:complete
MPKEYKRKGPLFKVGDRVYKQSDGYQRDKARRPPIYGRIVEYKPKENSIGRLTHFYDWLPDGSSVPEPTVQQRLTLVKEEPNL